MRWIRKLFGRVEASQGEALLAPPDRLALVEVGPWLEERSREVSLDKVDAICTSLGKLASDLEAHAKALEMATPGDDVMPRLMKAGLAGRENVLRQLAILQRSLSPPEETTVDLVAEYHSELVRHMERTGTKFGRSQRYAGLLFSQESEAIMADLAEVSRLLVELGRSLESKNKETSIYGRAKALASVIGEAQGQISALRSDIERDRSRLEELISLEMELELELDSLLSSEDRRALDDLKGALVLRRGDLRRVEAEMADLVAPLAKALTRVLKQNARSGLSLEHGETLEHGDTLELLLKSPHQAIYSDLAGPLRELRSHLGDLGLRARKREKVLEGLERLLDEGFVEGLREGRSAVLAEIEDIEEEIRAKSSGVSEAEADLGRLRERIGRLRERLEQEEAGLRSVEARAETEAAALRKAVEEIAGGPVDIDIRVGEGLT